MTRIASVDRNVVACHEAAHAVMRWLRGLPATEIRIDRNGDGACAGTGCPVDPESYVLVALAGFAAEDLTASTTPLPKLVAAIAGCPAEDFEMARRVVRHTPRLRQIVRDGRHIEVSIDEAVARYFLCAIDLILPHVEVVADLGAQLDEDGIVSARKVGAALRAAAGEVHR